MSDEAPGRAHMGFAIREALSAFATAPVVETILRRALERARLGAVPPGGQQLADFLDQHLAPCVADAVGADTADAVRQTLDPILRMTPDPEALARAVQRQPRRRRATAPNMRLDAPLVIVASTDAARLGELEVAVRGAWLQHADDAVLLLSAVQGAGGGRRFIVLDCVSPSLEVLTLATLAPELPPDAVILLWGASTDHEQMLTDLGVDTGSWIRCGAQVSALQVASLMGLANLG